MNKPVTNADVIQIHQERLIRLRNEIDREVQIINLLTATELVAQDAKVRAKAKEAKPTAKTKRRKTLQWKPASNASPYVQTLYDALGNGKPLTTLQLHQRVLNAGFTNVTEAQVSGSLNWMRQSGRLTQNKGHWRRKHARYAQKNEPITSDQITGTNAHKVMGRYDRDVERGLRTKTVDENGLIRWSEFNAPSSGTDQ